MSGSLLCISSSQVLGRLDVGPNNRSSKITKDTRRDLAPMSQSTGQGRTHAEAPAGQAESRRIHRMAGDNRFLFVVLGSAMANVCGRDLYREPSLSTYSAKAVLFGHACIVQIVAAVKLRVSDSGPQVRMSIGPSFQPSSVCADPTSITKAAVEALSATRPLTLCTCWAPEQAVRSVIKFTADTGPLST